MTHDVNWGINQYKYLKFLTLQDFQTFYAGHWKVSHVRENEWSRDYQSLKAGSMILVKPNFIPCVIKSVSEAGNFHVTAFDKDIVVTPYNTVIPRLPVYNDQEVIQFLDEPSKKWQLARIIERDLDLQKYTLHFISDQY